MKIKTNCGGWQFDENGKIEQGTLDSLLRGGLELPKPDNSNDGLVILIRGKAGTGKSTLALQLASNIDIQSESGPSPATQYFSLEQDAEELRHIHCRMAVNQELAHLELSNANSPPEEFGKLIEAATERLAITAGLPGDAASAFHNELASLMKKLCPTLQPPAQPPAGQSEADARQAEKAREKERSGIRQAIFQHVYSSVEERLREALNQTLQILPKDPSDHAAYKTAAETLWKEVETRLGYKAGEDKSRIEDTAASLRKWAQAENPEEKTQAEILAMRALSALLPERTTAIRAARRPIRFQPLQHGATQDVELVEDPISTVYNFLDTLAPDRAPARNERPVVIIDGLSTLSTDERGQITLGQVMSLLRARSLIGIIAYEPTDGEGETLDHQADLVINLQERHLTTPMAYTAHELQFRKSRYQEAALGWHQYKIRSYGLEIYPSVHFLIHAHLFMTRQLIGSLAPMKAEKRTESDDDRGIIGSSILDRILGGVRPGHSVALLGPRGAFKTTLSMDFLFRSSAAPCPAGPNEERPVPQAEGQPSEHGLLVSIIDSEDNLRSKKSCPIGAVCQHKDCLNIEGKAGAQLEHCLQHCFLFYQRPGCISASEFLYYLKSRLQMAPAASPIKRLAFWDLTQLEHRFPLLANDPMFLPAMLDLFRLTPSANERDHMIKSVFMGAANAKFSRAISEMADNVVFCWRDRANNGGPEKIDMEARLKELKDGGKLWPDTVQAAELPKKEFLLIYVDRSTGLPGNERKGLFAFPIREAAKPKKTSTLAVPPGDWVATAYEIEYDDVRLFAKARGMIAKIDELQGFEDLPNR